MTWLQTLGSGAFDLLAPTAQDVYLPFIGVSLAKTARFNGHNSDDPYSVAQHSVLGADQIMRELRRKDCAAYFLLHDCKESMVGDEPSPKKEAHDARIDQILIDRGYPQLVGLGKIARRSLEYPIDRVIHEAAGLSWPPTDEIAAIVKRYDIAMLATEKRDLMAPAPKPWAAIVEQTAPLRMKTIKPWSWRKAADAFHIRISKYLPSSFSDAA